MATVRCTRCKDTGFIARPASTAFSFDRCDCGIDPRDVEIERLQAEVVRRSREVETLSNPFRLRGKRRGVDGGG